MSSPSNLYAEKIFSEHPSILWSLDDTLDYISLLSDSQRDLTNWNISGGIAEIDNSLLDEPFVSATTFKITGDIPAGDSAEISCISENILNFNSLNSELANFSIGTYVYSKSAYITGYSIGYEYYDDTSGANIQKLKSYTTTIADQWVFISETFEIPKENTTFRIVLKINYLHGTGDTSDYLFYVNGTSIGQWSEEFNSTSLGISIIDIPNNISIAPYKGIEATSYGLVNKPGYYLVKDNLLLAKNAGVPIVYGSSNVTTLVANNNEPSLIIPGNGFLNENGKHKEYTLEMWMRINSDSSTLKRIVGPLGSDDGIYVEGPFIGLKINNNYKSHYIGEWTRPMLVHIRITNNSANMLINGEEVLALNFITSDLVFPNKNNESGKDQDWIGFYSYDDIFPIDIDCVAIYPYQVPSVVAKRRFVYGQGVEFPENINSAYSGSSVYVDYAFADYTNNYNYPDIGTWSQGTYDNLSVTDSTIGLPEYQLPSIILSNKTSNDFFTDNLIPSQQEFGDLNISFRPNESWNTTDGYMLFNNFNLINQETKAFFATFKRVENNVEPQTLIRIENTLTNDFLTIDISSEEIAYTLSLSGVLQEPTYIALGNTIGEKFSIGIDLDTFSNYFGGNVASFLGNRGALRMYVGGNKELSNTFTGKIYNIGFCTDKNLSKISHLFNELGVQKDYENIFDLYNQEILYEADDAYFGDGGSEYLIQDSSEVFEPNDRAFWQYIISGGLPGDFAPDALRSHIASYMLVPKIYFESLELDIKIDSSWEDYVPLSYFAQYIEKANGDKVYDLDFIQFNINYPAPSIFKETEISGSWQYLDLYKEYSDPVQRTYESLDNHLFTGYVDYEDLKNRSVKTYNYDTEKSMIKTYITFQYIAAGANANQVYFTNTESAPKSGIVEPGSNWINTRYEVVDNMLIYPPVGVDINDLAIVTHIDFLVDGINHNPIKIRSLQLASQSFNESYTNPIGTRFGIPMYPYRKTGIYYTYKYNNPFTIYKGSSPYLYLTRNSGIKLRGVFDPLINRGLSIPINQTKTDNYKVMAMQAAVRFDEDFFPYAPTEIMEIESKNALIKLYMVANHPSGKRAKIYAVNGKTGMLEDGIGFYWNGKIVKEPVITIKEWGFLGISFANILDMSNTTGSIRLNGPLLFNNISYYQTTNLQEVQKVSKRPWFKVKYAGPNILDWDFWSDSYIWQGVLVLSSTSYYGVDPSDIYKTYTGTNKIVIDDETPFRFNLYQYSMYKDVSWQSTISNAV